MPRGFEIVTKYQDADLTLPKRATKGSAGYDIAVAEDTVVPSFWRTAVTHIAKDWAPFNSYKDFAKAIDLSQMKPVLVPTGLKVQMPENEYLQLTCRSSNPLKRSLVIPNGVGIIDSDYYNNVDNEGEMFVQLLNFGLEDVEIKKGERIAQGIFLSYGLTDDDVADGERLGGFGSSDAEVAEDSNGEEA